MSRIEPRNRARNFVLLDGTMAGRDVGASDSDVPPALFRAAASAAARDIVISSPSIDHLLYAHLDLFRYVSGNDEHRNRW